MFNKSEISQWICLKQEQAVAEQVGRVSPDFVLWQAQGRVRSSHLQSREVALFIMSVRMLILGVSQAGKQMVCMKHTQEFMWYAVNVMEVKGKELLGLKGSVTTKLVEGEAGLSGSAPSPCLTRLPSVRLQAAAHKQSLSRCAPCEVCGRLGQPCCQGSSGTQPGPREEGALKCMQHCSPYTDLWPPQQCWICSAVHLLLVLMLWAASLPLPQHRREAKSHLPAQHFAMTAQTDSSVSPLYAACISVTLPVLPLAVCQKPHEELQIQHRIQTIFHLISVKIICI